MDKYRVAEHFVSINGEGQRAGELALFIRFTGCNLNCSWCDTKWANEPGAPYTEMSTREICETAKQCGTVNITLTGGEPLLQPDIAGLIKALAEQGHSVEVETNGSVPLPEGLDCDVTYTMDCKLPSSGMADRMCRENYGRLTSRDTVKFVCGSQEDLRRAAEVIAEHDLTNRCRVYLSPVFGMTDPKDIVDFMKDRGLNGVRLQLQLHKFIWDPNERGV
ncbi:MAG: putative 7-carboxy-7-deazaguanine synthase QueE [Ruminococcus sp.]|nr:putative 7-carboxy-7-deazaguanine synthase QueE [Ruminococcus sp.]